MTQVKICGVTTVADAMDCVEAGADAIGLNFWPSSPRHVGLETAQQIVEAVGSSAALVGVFVDASLDEILETKEAVGFSWTQLHGQEPPSLVERLLPDAYKAIGVDDDAVIEEARRFPGEHLLLDARVPGMPGGTGQTFDWSIAAEVAKERKLTLAGGLTPDNVAQAVERVRPYRVDVASGVERTPGRKDPDLVRAFITSARLALLV